MGVALLETFKTKKFQQPRGSTRVLSPAQAKTGVLPCVEVREQCVILKHHAHPTSLGRQRAVGSCHITAMQTHHTAGWSLKSSNQPQQCGFAAAGRSQESDQLSTLKLEVDCLQGPIITGSAITMPETFDLDRQCPHRHEKRRCSHIVSLDHDSFRDSGR